MINKLRFLINYLKFAKNPKRTELIFKFIDAIRAMPEKKELFDHYQSVYLNNDAFKKMWEEKYFPQLSTDELSKMPSGSFGRTYFEFLQKHNLDLNFYPEIEIQSAIDYFILRLYKTHDMYHVLLNEDISYRAELAVQAFTLAQTQSGIPAIILSGGLLHEAQNNPLDIPQHFEDLFRLYHLGKSIPPLFGIRLESYMEMPLTEVRSLLGIDNSGKMAKAVSLAHVELTN
tara:strand:+ start:31590 stop:32279 length:690 start_codon:yes stop_codon:yes gene_type:complete